MGKKRDDEVTQQIRVGRELLDDALRASQEAARRINSSAPPKPEESCDEAEQEAEDETREE